jgi:hypothetical protein
VTLGASHTARPWSPSRPSHRHHAQSASRAPATASTVQHEACRRRPRVTDSAAPAPPRSPTLTTVAAISDRDRRGEQTSPHRRASAARAMQRPSGQKLPRGSSTRASCPPRSQVQPLCPSIPELATPPICCPGNVTHPTDSTPSICPPTGPTTSFAPRYQGLQAAGHGGPPASALCHDEPLQKRSGRGKVRTTPKRQTRQLCYPASAIKPRCVEQLRPYALTAPSPSLTCP